MASSSIVIPRSPLRRTTGNLSVVLERENKEGFLSRRAGSDWRIFDLVGNRYKLPNPS
jgi:hypothetical protein